MNKEDSLDDKFSFFFLNSTGFWFVNVTSESICRWKCFTKQQWDESVENAELHYAEILLMWSQAILFLVLI